MTTLTINSALRTALRVTCCAVALAASSTWASVVTWQLKPTGSANNIGFSKALSASVFPNPNWSADKAPLVGTSRQIEFATAPEVGAAAKESGQALLGALHKALPGDVTESGDPSSVQGNRSAEPLLFVATSSVSRPSTELDEAMARSTFNEDFVSVPTIQFAAMVTGSTALSVIAPTNVGVVPVPEMSALFPILGLIVAVSCTQILRRRRAAQQSTFRRLV